MFSCASEAPVETGVMPGKGIMKSSLADREGDRAGFSSTSAAVQMRSPAPVPIDQLEPRVIGPCTVPVWCCKRRGAPRVDIQRGIRVVENGNECRSGVKDHKTTDLAAGDDGTTCVCARCGGRFPAPGVESGGKAYCCDKCARGPGYRPFLVLAGAGVLFGLGGACGWAAARRRRH